jgi:hypothetical protein
VRPKLEQDGDGGRRERPTNAASWGLGLAHAATCGGGGGGGTARGGGGGGGRGCDIRHLRRPIAAIEPLRGPGRAGPRLQRETKKNA